MLETMTGAGGVGAGVASEGRSRYHPETQSHLTDSFRSDRRPQRLLMFCNGDRHFSGKTVLVNLRQYRHFGDFLSDMTNRMPQSLPLAHGVRQLFSPDTGARINQLSELRDGSRYVCAGFESYKPMPYGERMMEYTPPIGGELQHTGRKRTKSLQENLSLDTSRSLSTRTDSAHHQTPRSPLLDAAASNRQRPYANGDQTLTTGTPALGKAKPRIITIYRNSRGSPQNVKILFNRNSVQSYEQFLSDVGDAFETSLPGNRIRRLVGIGGKEVRGISDLFRDVDVFLGLGREEIELEGVLEILRLHFPNSYLAEDLAQRWERIVANQAKRPLENIQNVDLETDRSGVGSLTTRRRRGPRLPKKFLEKRAEAIERMNNLPVLPAIKADQDDLDEENIENGGSARKRDTSRLKTHRPSVINREKSNDNVSLPPIRNELSTSNVGERTSRIGQTSSRDAGVDADSSPRVGSKVRRNSSGDHDVSDHVTHGEADDRRQIQEELQKDEGFEDLDEISKHDQSRRHQSDLDDHQHIPAAPLRDEEFQDLSETLSKNKNRRHQSDLDDLNRTGSVELNNTSGKDADDDEQDLETGAVISNAKETDTPVENGVVHIPERAHQRLLPSYLVLEEKYDLGKTLGDGNFAIVKSCRERSTGKEYAMKIVDKAKLRGKEDLIENEILVMKACNHPNIVKLFLEYETSAEIFLLMELVGGGDLFDFITENAPFSEVEAAGMIYDLAKALSYLHCRNIVHRDVKPENIVVQHGSDDLLSLKLADFGLATEVRGPLYTVCGTPTYVAPEILAEIGYGLEVDLWATGVILYILMCGFAPFRGEDPDQLDLFEAIKSGHFEFTPPYWNNASDGVRDLITHLLQVDARRRCTALDVICHPFIITCAGSFSPPNIEQLRKNLRNELTKDAADNRDSFAAVLAKLR